jgi:DNA-directed RNA polymerase subunit RPC12/RpoP
MTFVVVCTSCWKNTKYDALSDTRGLACDKCGESL